MNTANDDTALSEDGVSALLPFYLNGTLSDSERTRVVAALERDQALRDELALWEHVRDGLVARDAADPMAGPAPSREFALARLARDVRMEASGPDTAAAIRPSAPRWRLARFGAAAAAMLVLGVVVGRVVPWTGEADYRAAGEAPGVEATQPGTVLAIAFAPTAPAGAVADLLRREGLSIIGGPSAIGLYRVRTLNPEAGLEDVLRRLRESDLVESAAYDQ